ncbi:hypothetical protein DPMN_048182 [Dreissena polymorpha]|uniref:Uncharacterized protein n=1 Tax=Dreissena polymorpha TaxID=45954 RepID=A0A9D4I2M1_DREPO|nr:hypothetical protein DPMN_048182 [Dreissena polymorpha]
MEMKSTFCSASQTDGLRKTFVITEWFTYLATLRCTAIWSMAEWLGTLIPYFISVRTIFHMLMRRCIVGLRIYHHGTLVIRRMRIQTIHLTSCDWVAKETKMMFLSVTSMRPTAMETRITE